MRISAVEIRRYSITRLKRNTPTSQKRLYRASVEIRRYSITRLKQTTIAMNTRRWWRVEIRRYSITRLKHHASSVGGLCKLSVEIRRYSITRLKQKKAFVAFKPPFTLKLEDTRLRDWNCRTPWAAAVARVVEIRRYSITRLKLAMLDLKIKLTGCWN